jgi:hypothetical protein
MPLAWRGSLRRMRAHLQGQLPPVGGDALAQKHRRQLPRLRAARGAQHLKQLRHDLRLSSRAAQDLLCLAVDKATGGR